MQLQAVLQLNHYNSFLISASAPNTCIIARVITSRSTVALKTKFLAQTHFRKTETIRSHPKKCIGYSDASQNSPQATNFSNIKQCLNQSALTEYNPGVRLPFPT
jgi:hypothetical protein